MRHIKLFEGFTQSDDEVRMMAWLYFLKNPYDGTLTISSWEKDKRMDGMTASDAMKKLITLGYAIRKNTEWKITPAGIKAADDFFLEPSMKAAAEASRKLSKFDPTRRNYDMYPMSKIPVEYRIKYEKSLRKYQKSDTLTEQDYHFIRTFIERYERDIIHDLSRMKKYVGKANELCEDKDYTLYRGVNVSNEHLKDAKVGGKFRSGNQAVQSWTTSKHVAVQFSLGNPTPMQVSVDNNRFPEKFGIVMKHVFPASQVVLDLVYIDEMNPELLGAMAFNEEEVLVLAGKNKEFEIAEIHDERGEVNPHF